MDTLRALLGERLPVEIQIVPLAAAQRNPRLLSEILRDGRPLVDREDIWPGLQAQAGLARAQADLVGQRLRAEALDALGYFRRLAGARARTPVGSRA
jgi:hypothetical protein